jgi:hypothetical protein
MLSAGIAHFAFPLLLRDISAAEAAKIFATVSKRAAQMFIMRIVRAPCRKQILKE